MSRRCGWSPDPKASSQSIKGPALYRGGLFFWSLCDAIMRPDRGALNASTRSDRPLWDEHVGKAKDNYTAEQRAAMRERARLLKSPRMATEQERLRLLGEKLGLNKLRKAGTAAPSPQKPTPQQRRKRGRVGRKRSLAQEKIDEGIRILRDQPKMTVEAARRTLRDAGIDTTDTALYELVIRQAYGSARIRK